MKGGKNLEDHNIVDLYWFRDENAISETDKKYGSYCNTIANNILYNLEDSKECVNDTYLKFWRNAENYDIKQASLSTYLKVIVRNTAINKLRDLKRHEDKLYSDDVSDIANAVTDHNQNIENQMVRKENVKKLNGIIASLPERDRELVIRKYFYLQSSKIIAKAMNMTVTAVDSRLSRLRTKVKNVFDEMEYQERGKRSDR